MRISCALPPVLDTPRHIELAEQLGYHTAWVYDTPALQLDVWMTLAIAATRTTRITLGPGVLIPSLRHPMVTASAIAHLVGLVGAPRVVVGVGTGFTGRMAMGQKPLTWGRLPERIATIQALLAGETVTIDGGAARLLHGEGHAPPRPITVRWALGVSGPKGLGVAQALGLGVLVSSRRSATSLDGLASVTLLSMGTVVAPDEEPTGERVWEAAGPAVAVAYHGMLERHDPRFDTLPDAATYRALVEAEPEATRHLAIHVGHLTRMNDIDRQVVTPERAVAMSGLTGTIAEIRAKVDQAAAAGVTEVAFQPTSDVERELTRMAEALAPWIR